MTCIISCLLSIGGSEKPFIISAQSKEGKSGNRVSFQPPCNATAAAAAAILTVMHGRQVIVPLDLARSAQIIVAACLQ